MITLITGVPGAGKTAAAVDLIVREYADRPLFVDGLDGLTLEHESIDALEWPDNVPDGAVIVIDEVQRRWRPRGAGAKVPPSVAALETHRHHGLDFIVITQSPKLLDSNVRGLVGRHLHIRDTGFLGRWVYEWPETNIDLAYRTCQNKRRYTLPRKVFGLYKSASMHVKPVRKVPPLAYIAGVGVVALVVLGGFAVRQYGRAVESKPASVGPAAPVVQSSVALGGVPSAPDRVAGPPDERVDFIPRIGGRPWTAPAYDVVRQVVRMPHVAGAICNSDKCVCVSELGERLDVPDSACREWLDLPRFNPYREPERPAIRQAAAVAPGQSSEAAQAVPVPTSWTNPHAESHWSSDQRKASPQQQ